jgi:hypothetical protein
MVAENEKKKSKSKVLVEIYKSSMHTPFCKFTGRLIEIVNAEECRALINTPDIARRLYSSGALELKEDTLVGPVMLWRNRSKRFIVATDNFYDWRCRAVFISPVIIWSYKTPSGYRIINCRDGCEYKIKETIEV